MFIEHSIARRRIVRLLFLAVALLPCAALAGAAWWRHSAGHLAAVKREASASLGVPVEIGGIVHPRPRTLRLSDVVVGGVLALPEVEVEATATEVRVRVPRVPCTPAAARVLAELVGEWLRRAERFPQSWVVDVGEVEWAPAHGRGIEAGGWHVECVAAGDARAVRLRREPATAGEIRVRLGVDGLAVEGTLEEGVPVPIMAALTGGGWAEAFGPQALVRGTLRAGWDAGGWAGEATGVIERVDLAAAHPGGGRRLQGEATLEVAALRFAAGRLEDCDLALTAVGGALTQDVLEDLASSFGCHPGPAYRALAGDAVRRFDTLSCRILLGAEGLRLRAVDGAGGALITSQGLALLEESTVAVPAARLAWLLSPAGRPAVPASAVSGWLISVLPASGGF